MKLNDNTKIFLESCKGEREHPRQGGKPIDISRVKKLLRDACKRYISLCIKAKIRVPRLDVLMFGNDPGSKSYVTMKKKAGDGLGLITKVHHFTEQDCAKSEGFSIRQKIYTSDVVYNKLINEINECYNKNSACMVQLPIQNNRHIESQVLSRISGLMDVDGLNPRNRTRYIIDDIKIISDHIGVNMNKVINYLTPCTPAGIRAILIEIFGGSFGVTNKNIVIIGRSNLIGKPLAEMLTADNANVTLLHSYTSMENLKNHCLNADIIISATGQANLVTADMINEDHRQILIDAGFSLVENEEGKMVVNGDIAKECRELCRYYTPYTKCIGPLTISILMYNVCLFHFLQLSPHDVSDEIYDSMKSILFPLGSVFDIQ